MERVSSQHLRQVVKYLQDHYVWRNEDAYLSYLLESLPGLLHMDVCSFNEIDYQKKSNEYYYAPASFPVLPDAQERYIHGMQDPFIAPFLQQVLQLNLAEPRRLSDLIRQSVWKNTIYYQEFYYPHRIPFTLFATIQSDRTIRLNIGLHRSSRDFTDQEQTMFSLVVPHIIQGFQHARRVNELEVSRSSSGSSPSHRLVAKITINAAGNIREMEALAVTMLRHFGTERHWVGASLPAPFKEWVHHHIRDRGDYRRFRWTPQPLLLSKGPDRLTCSLTREREHWVLLLVQETADTPQWQILRSFDITQREYEILTWLVQGKTNEEMSQILGAKPGTIQKHLGSLYKKVGVENRTALVAQVLELLWKNPGSGDEANSGGEVR